MINGKVDTSSLAGATMMAVLGVLLGMYDTSRNIAGINEWLMQIAQYSLKIDIGSSGVSAIGIIFVVLMIFLISIAMYGLKGMA